MPVFPQLAEMDATTDVVATGPDNDILNGKPLKVPIIVDPFAQEPGSEEAKVMDRIVTVLGKEPPSAAQPKPNAATEVDILEVLDRASQAAKAAAAKAAGKKAKAKAVSKQLAGKGNLKQLAEAKKEIQALKKMIKKAENIEKELPKKKKRLQRLEKKLHSQAAKSAAKLAGAKAGAEVKVASNVNKKIGSLKNKLAKLEAAKKLLRKSIDGLQKVATGQAVSPALIEEVENSI